MVDPLVINYDAPSAQLGEATFSFDLDADGVGDQISLFDAGQRFFGA